MSLSCALTALTYINYYKGQQDLNFFQRHNTEMKKCTSECYVLWRSYIMNKKWE